MVLKLTQSQLVASKAKEVVPIHPHFATDGAFYRKGAADMDGSLVRAEMEKMMRGEPGAAYYPAFQPIYCYPIPGSEATEETVSTVTETENVEMISDTDELI